MKCIRVMAGKYYTRFFFKLIDNHIITNIFCDCMKLVENYCFEVVGEVDCPFRVTLSVQY